MGQVVQQWDRWYNSGTGGTTVGQVVQEWDRWYKSGTGGTTVVQDLILEITVSWKLSP